MAAKDEEDDGDGEVALSLPLKWAQWRDRLFLRLAALDCNPDSIRVALDGFIRKADAATNPTLR